MEPELDRVIEHAEATADRAASRTFRLWAFALVLVGVIVAGVVHDVRFLGIAVFLAILYAIPYLVAGISTTWGDQERRDLTKSIHGHQERERAHAEEQTKEQRGLQPGKA